MNSVANIVKLRQLFKRKQEHCIEIMECAYRKRKEWEDCKDFIVNARVSTDGSIEVNHDT